MSSRNQGSSLCESIGRPIFDNRYSLASLGRLLRKLDVLYYDNFIENKAVQTASDTASHTLSGISVRKIKAPPSHRPSYAATRTTLAQAYLEICILRQPALRGHPFLQELLGVTLISPNGDPHQYQLGLIVNEEHGTLEDLLAVERKTSRDPRSYLISWAEREEIILQCAEGLAAVHDCNILHNNVQPSSFAVCITQSVEGTRAINIKLSNFGDAVPLSSETIIEDIEPANGQWSEIGPLANCISSPFCRDIHSFGLMVMYLTYYEFMNVQDTMDFLKTQRGFYDELGMHPALDTALSLFHIVSRCCISHGGQPISMHWVAPTIKK